MAADEQGDLYQRALDIAATAKRFQMQSFRSSTGEWIPMENGTGGHVWRPRATAVDAAAKCLAWTGFIGIPAMQVIDMGTGEVVWRFTDRYPQAGESITLPAADERLAREQARKVLAGHNPRPSAEADRPQLQTSLFELPDRD
jgi:hypothetical protein